MTKITYFSGAILIILGVGAYFATGADSPTALIPTYVGITLVLCGWLSTLGHVMRMIFAHLAVLIGVVGTLGGLGMSLPKLLSGAELARPLAIYLQLAMGLVLLVYTILCIKSFIDARRARASGEVVS